MLVGKTLPQPSIRRVVFTNGRPLPFAQVGPPPLPVLHSPGIFVQPACFTVRHIVLPFLGWPQTHSSIFTIGAGQISGHFQGTRVASCLSKATVRRGTQPHLRLSPMHRTGERDPTQCTASC